MAHIEENHTKLSQYRSAEELHVIGNRHKRKERNGITFFSSFFPTETAISTLLLHRANCYIYFIQNQLMHFF
jgi:hypothetical protein